jgi:mannonate dehydratase
MRAPLIPIAPGIKVAYQAPEAPTEADLAFIQQLGVEYVVFSTKGDKASAEHYTSRRQLYQDAGIKVFGVVNASVHNQDAIVLGLEGRDAKIEEYKRHIRALGQAGIPYTTYAHMANGIWSSEPGSTRGQAVARSFDLAGGVKGFTSAGRVYSGELTHGRSYSPQEIWDNFEYFIKQVAPVAEEAGVRIGIHPDDPPLDGLGGIPRCIFSSFEGYRQALEIADSPNVGICLCVGCWIEGGERMGKSVEDTIRYFSERGKLFKVHLRNIDRPLPHFVETFLDNGYYSMARVVKTLCEVEFNGIMIPDHIPAMADSPRVGSAFSIGYMKGLVDQARS